MKFLLMGKMKLDRVPLENTLGLDQKGLGVLPAESKHEEAGILKYLTFHGCSTTLIADPHDPLGPVNGKAGVDATHLSMHPSNATVWKHGSSDAEGNGHCPLHQTLLHFAAIGLGNFPRIPLVENN